MKLAASILSLILLLGAPEASVLPMIPSLEMETDYVWNCIEQTRFFDDHGYELAMPSGELIHGLQVDARLGILHESSKSDLKKHMKKKVYTPSDYLAGMKKVEDQVEDLESMIRLIDDEDYSWGFKIFPQYKVKLTLYGPGGSYDAEQGSILLYTTAHGSFKNYDDPAYTLIHEIVHIGIEESIIGKYQVPHAMKERIVDKMVILLFGDVLHGYRVQNMGDRRIDPYLKTPEDIHDLDQAVQKALEE